jgi:hypothetical protein
MRMKYGVTRALIAALLGAAASARAADLYVSTTGSDFAADHVLSFLPPS